MALKLEWRTRKSIWFITIIIVIIIIKNINVMMNTIEQNLRDITYIPLYTLILQQRKSDTIRRVFIHISNRPNNSKLMCRVQKTTIGRMGARTPNADWWNVDTGFAVCCSPYLRTFPVPKTIFPGRFVSWLHLNTGAIKRKQSVQRTYPGTFSTDWYFK